MEQKKILIVDDDNDIRSLYADVFRTAKFDVREANDGLDALEMVNQIVPDVILTGIIMPRMDGFQFFDALKKNVVTSDIPVVFLSHLGREEDERRALEMGAKDFIVRTLVPPLEAVKRVQALVTSGELRVALATAELDAPRLATLLGLPKSFRTEKGTRFLLNLRIRNTERREFDATIVEQ